MKPPILKYLLPSAFYILSLSSYSYAEDDKEAKLKKSIAILNKHRKEHEKLINSLFEKKESDGSNEELIQASTKFIFNNVKVGESIFNYPGILGAGRVVTDKEGYQLIMYEDNRDFGDTAEENPLYYIIYISKKGIIHKTFSTPSLVQ